jgi:hypothetical protein
LSRRMAATHDVTSSGERRLLRHALATIAYRASRVIVDPPPGYATLQIDPTARTPVEILAHMGDLMDWALSIARGAQAWHTSTPLAWDAEVDRFFVAVGRLDAYLATDAPLGWPPDRLLQAPIADTLTHVGQLAMLRRVAGRPVRGEHYGEATIEVGRVGRDQAPARVSID